MKFSISNQGLVGGPELLQLPTPTVLTIRFNKPSIPSSHVYRYTVGYLQRSHGAYCGGHRESDLHLCYGVSDAPHTMAEHTCVETRRST
ncbi:hypothetical protein HCBG_06147 [Histoplasma capsulatum G186AR]|uniref:Uncharacterized protein n=1 Tax=Ajellomyces capsulatus (strain G186AR / H82 / ATCC MYA-2454 / RMSCC 2432) TaxID=447093 RepID=C0NSL7_AJECG|nr:uncharacterized protein HCBG_06147 [Histoplasma capsulatum G186AR]EEH05883.1 hypothetical protein HCBG_06147 [Histoplasma capsulatum G186AR]